MLARAPLVPAPVCVIRTKPASGFTGSVWDTFEATVDISGASRAAVEEAVRDYKASHPGSWFRDIFHRDGVFSVRGGGGPETRR